MNLASFTQAADAQNTDMLVGYRTAAAGGERRWPFSVLVTAVSEQLAGGNVSFVAFPANSAAAGAIGQLSYDNGVFAVYIGQAGSGGPNWIFIGAFERD